ncbi:zinc finger protein 513-like [Penaeus chinensis]|uniref:zinc finger protein 513-like n=1 Tax=Penaeus chinensis TaxID=139456 RepID=UPI001FB6E8D7|nr:zinc finger protein 513-like [Penaeus chinensis]
MLQVYKRDTARYMEKTPSTSHILYQYSQCDFSATDANELKKHILKHKILGGVRKRPQAEKLGRRPKRKEKSQCSQVAQVFILKSNLNSHLLTHHPELQSHHIDIQTHHPDDQALLSDDQSHHSDVFPLLSRQYSMLLVVGKYMLCHPTLLTCMSVEEKAKVELDSDGERTRWGGDAVRTKKNTGKMHRCSYCNYVTNKTTNLIRHIHTHTGEKPFSCPYCPYRATQENNIKSHIRTHTGEKPYKCPHCPYCSSQKSSLRNHILTHQNYITQRCQSPLLTHCMLMVMSVCMDCMQLCNYDFSGNSDFSTLGPAVPVLPGCGPHIAGEGGPCVGIQDGNLRLPQNSYGSHAKGTQPFLVQVHPGDKPFDCPHCSYSSATRDYLKIHIRTHTGEKPFPCPHCSFRAAQKNNLNRHLRIHTGEKPYACNICPYRSSQKNNLKSHLLTHRSQSDVENIM